MANALSRVDRFGGPALFGLLVIALLISSAVTEAWASSEENKERSDTLLLQSRMYRSWGIILIVTVGVMMFAAVVMFANYWKPLWEEPITQRPPRQK